MNIAVSSRGRSHPIGWDGPGRLLSGNILSFLAGIGQLRKLRNSFHIGKLNAADCTVRSAMRKRAGNGALVTPSLMNQRSEWVVRVKYGEGKYKQTGPFTYEYARMELERIIRKHYPHWAAAQKISRDGQTS